MIHKYGLVPQNKDVRDFVFALAKAAELPQEVDLRDKCPPVFDQLDTNSCTANAGVAARMMVGNIAEPLSRLYLYYQERRLEGTTGVDNGATMRSICKALQKYGVCEERLFPFDKNKITKTPCVFADLGAAKYKIDRYISFGDDSINDTLQIRQYLSEAKQPVLIGMTVYESFESESVANSGAVPMPDTAKEKLLGGHAVLIVGYDDAKQVFIVRNSWGPDWGNKGYFYLPYAFVEAGFAFDAWVIE